MDLENLLKKSEEFGKVPFAEGKISAEGVTLTRNFLQTSNPKEKILYSCFEQDSIAPHSNFVICHGGFEHSRRYDFLAYTVACKGFICHSLDLRGQGMSDGLRCGTSN